MFGAKDTEYLLKMLNCACCSCRALYTSRGYRCGNYSALIFVESKALKQEHSRLRNCFSNAAIGKNRPIEIRNCDRAKYNEANTDSLALQPVALPSRNLQYIIAHARLRSTTGVNE